MGSGVNVGAGVAVGMVVGCGVVVDAGVAVGMRVTVGSAVEVGAGEVVDVGVGVPSPNRPENLWTPPKAGLAPVLIADKTGGPPGAVDAGCPIRKLQTNAVIAASAASAWA